MYTGSADGRTQIPAPLVQTAFSNATMPAQKIKTKNPDHIIINQSGSYSFLYQHTGSLGSSLTGMTYVSGSNVDNLSSPMRVDISPCAWQSNNGNTGDVTFVYRGN